MTEPSIPPPLAPASAAAPLAPAPAPAPARVAAIELDHVSRWYGNVVAVNDISFALGAGVTGLLGPNGAGKSTLLHLLAGLLAPSSGAVRIAGRSAFGDPSVYRDVGLVPEREAVPGYLTGHEFALLNAELQGVADPRGAADTGHRHGRADRGGPPPDPHVFQGDAPARQARRRRSSTSRGSCCSTSRSTAWTRASGCT